MHGDWESAGEKDHARQAAEAEVERMRSGWDQLTNDWMKAQNEANELRAVVEKLQHEVDGAREEIERRRVEEEVRQGDAVRAKRAEREARAEVEELRAERDHARASNVQYINLLPAVESERDTLKAKVEELRAERALAVSVYEETVGQLVEQRDAWRAIAEGRAKLLACYRVGTQRGAPTALDAIRKAEKVLARYDEPTEEPDAE